MKDPDELNPYKNKTNIYGNKTNIYSDKNSTKTYVDKNKTTTYQDKSKTSIYGVSKKLTKETVHNLKTDDGIILNNKEYIISLWTKKERFPKISKNILCVHSIILP